MKAALLMLCSVATAQSSTGLLAPNRVLDWSKVGAVIETRITVCQTLNPGVTSEQIADALRTCRAGQVVKLNPGTYVLSGSIFQNGGAPSNVTLRGSGPKSTILRFNSPASLRNCSGTGRVPLCIGNGDNGSLNWSANVFTVTSGVRQGSTSVTLGAAPPAHSLSQLSALRVGSLIGFNQLDDPLIDNRNWWECGHQASGTVAHCSWQGVSTAWKGRQFGQIVRVTAISGNTVTFTPALYGVKWSQSQAPYATFSRNLPVVGFSIEDLTIDAQSAGNLFAIVYFQWAYNCWVRNVRTLNNTVVNLSSKTHYSITSSAHVTVRDSYMYGSNPQSGGYGVDFLWNTSDSLAENNISQRIAAGYILETGIGNVFGYNFAVDNYFGGIWQGCDWFHHGGGDTLNLVEGHVGICAVEDAVHGTACCNTIFRSYFSGHDPSLSTDPKTLNTAAFIYAAYNRYTNVVMNVFGTASYHTVYENIARRGFPQVCTRYPWTVIYSLGFANQNQLPFSTACMHTTWSLDNDDLSLSTLMRWGNYDTVTKRVHTNLSETASTVALLPSLASPSTNWIQYPSLYLREKPSFWGSTPWPGIGPEISGGDILDKAFRNPAALCYASIGGKSDGSSRVLLFDADECYYKHTSIPTKPSISHVLIVTTGNSGKQ